MDTQDINNIIVEISNLKNQGIVLSPKLDCERLISDYEIIKDQSRKGRYTLPRMYALVKRIQNYVKESLYHNDVNAFTTVETIRQKLNQEYQKRQEIVSKVRDIKKILN